LETFSKSIMPHIDWRWVGERIEVDNDTADLYRYFDATSLAEFMFAKVAETIRRDLRDELEFVSIYDGSLAAVLRIVDMPDRRASLLVRLCLQNGGNLSKKKRQDFKELTEEEVESMQEAIREVIAAHAQDTSEETHGM